ncbi:efflux RND transporter periplasmic adaptor subunit [Pelosinus sp. sgz500959]|uniref:efflux RND transporter periplasmic adaptor subunit n=1 Tax=Pelosinus sp. sgz500959 TaxID=3242472 RepID=UPI003672DD72
MLLQKRKKLSIVIMVMVVFSSIIGYRIYQNLSVSKERTAKMSQSKGVAVQVATVEVRDMIPVAEFSAGLEPVWSTDISAKVDSRIDTLQVAEGDRVEAGAVVATLDTNELSAQVLQAQGNLSVAQSSLEQAELDYNRYSALASQGAVSAQLLDNARTKRDAASGQVRAAEGTVRQAQEKLNNGTVVTPRGGVVTKRYVQSGTFTRVGAPIITVADLSTLLAKATIGEAQVAELKVGSSVTVKVDALSGQEFSGSIVRISPVAALPARTFTAEISIDNEQGLLKAGMFAKIGVPIKPHPNAVVIPESALVMREDQKTVFVLGDDNKVQQRVLKLGFIGGGVAEVLDGVKQGERIVVEGQNKIKDGIEVSAVKDGGQ